MSRPADPLRGLARAALASALAIVAPAAAQQSPGTAPEVASPSFFAVSVADLTASRAWYSRALGVEPVRDVQGRDGGNRAVVLRRDDLIIELIAFAGSRPPAALDPSLLHRFELQGLVKAGIFVHNAAAWHAHLSGLDIEVDAQVFTDTAVGARTFVFRDPDGNRIQVFEPCDPC